MALFKQFLSLLAFWLSLFLSLKASNASAVLDLASEANLHFEKATKCYKLQDYQCALEHFFLSNRLVPNRNVIFNIARTYENLLNYPDAFRYYQYSLAEEINPVLQKRILEAINRIKPYIGIIHVATDPPGIPFYVNRKDLGSWGSTPQILGLVPDTYVIIAESEGFHSAQSQPIHLQAGEEKTVSLKLSPLAASVQITSSPEEVQVAVDTPSSHLTCKTPCTLSVPLGSHNFFFFKEGFHSSQNTINLTQEGQTYMLRSVLTPFTGNLVINTSVRDTLIEVDGRFVGFTPTVVKVPVGIHHLRLSQPGYQTIERNFSIESEEQTKLDLEMIPSAEVFAASRMDESIEDAPSSVSVITAQELRAMGYWSIAEAVRGIRGIYLSFDNAYTSVGVRGISPLGNNGNRLLVLLDGHPTNNNYTGSSMVGYDARTDLEDIERIEVIRGPGSVSYGTGAFAGVINLVTHHRNLPTHQEINLSTVSKGVGGGHATTQWHFSPHAGFWTSVGGVHKSLEFDSISGNDADEKPDFNAGTIEGRMWYKSFSLQWFYNTRDKYVFIKHPHLQKRIPNNRFIDARGFLEARFEPKLNSQWQLLSRSYLNLYNLRSHLMYQSDRDTSIETFNGNWLGMEQRVMWTPLNYMRFTAGGEIQYHYKMDLAGWNTEETYLDRSDTLWIGAGYLMADFVFSPSFKLNLGNRFDYYSTSKGSFNPRIAVIWHPYADGNLKIMGGKAFRAPSAYELFYERSFGSDIQQGSSRDTSHPKYHLSDISLNPESLYSIEIELSHHFSPKVTGIIAAYANSIYHFIVLRGEGTQNSPLQFRNAHSSKLYLGGELELRREWAQGWTIAATYSLQQPSYINDNGNHRMIANVPQHMGSIKGSGPIINKTLMFNSRLTLESGRYDRFDRIHDTEPQGMTNPNVLWDVVFSGEAAHIPFRYSIGIYNVFDWRYHIPVSPAFTERTVRGYGRTLLVSTTLTF
ncbi:hypothetical protein BCY86_01565 [Pajaroellobacter abortibovis]|uniref:TonB-dependent receptor n=2 Tax=Pajaroellobacter abortibovis TaxID=1882918 RepID=A0A1L6MVE9_9BACT|nr:hypothetical protein BCY86_01565 [Pajaroellobacter abortibovis]